MKSDQKKKADMQVWVADSLKREVRDALENLARTEGIQRIAVMPDIHLAGNVCVGCVTATKNLMFPEAIGGDIGCGMAAIRFKDKAEGLLSPDLANRILAALYRKIPAHRHSRNSLFSLPANLEGYSLSHDSLEKVRKEDGLLQFATLGSGNHFVELQSDEEGFLWLMVHSGSRAMGQSIYHHHLKLAKSSKTGLAFLEAEGPEGAAFIQDHGFAVEYARQSRIRMVAEMQKIVGDVLEINAEPESFFECTHNFVRNEQHFGEFLWVHRKGAISAKPGELAMIPGSMGSLSFHVSGRGCEEALSSASHGAGREMSRQEAGRRISLDAFSTQMEGIFFDERRALKLLDEAPQAYKNISAVMRAQKELVRIDRRLMPVLNYKGV